MKPEQALASDHEISILTKSHQRSSACKIDRSRSTSLSLLLFLLFTIEIHRLRDAVREANILPGEQFGFLQGLSTDSQLLRLTQEVRNDVW